MRFFLTFCLLWWGSFSAMAAEEGKIVVSIKPLHSLVAGVMQGDEEPQLLVNTNASPHFFNLKPSDMKRLQNAEMVFYIDDHFEVFLPKLFKTTQTQVRMTDAPGITRYPQRENGIWQEEEDHHTHGGYDNHLWLAPKNAIVMTEFITAQLAVRYPEKATLYQANAAKQVAALRALDKEIDAMLAPVRRQPFVVFHDAYQYFEKAYGLNAQAAMTLSPEQLLSAKHIVALQRRMAEKNIHCVFSEPFVESRIIQALTKNAAVKTATLDPEAQALKPGAGLYAELMRGMAVQARECLGE